MNRPLSKSKSLIAAIIIALSLVEFLVPYLLYSSNGVPRGKDVSWHLENLVITYEAFTGRRPVAEILSSKVFYPPLVYILSLPFCMIAGSPTYRAGYLSFLLFILSMNIGLYFLGRELGGRSTGMVCPFAFLLFYTPLSLFHMPMWSFGMYNLQLPLCGWIPWLYLLLIRSRGLSELRYSMLFFVCLAASFWTYLWALPLMAPAVATALLLWRRAAPKNILNVFIGVALFALLVSPYAASSSFRGWLGTIFPNFLVGARAEPRIEPWSLFYRFGYAAYVSLLLWMIPVNILLVLSLLRIPWRDRGWKLLAFGSLGAFAALHLFKNMYAERLMPVLVMATPLLAFGLVRMLTGDRKKAIVALLVFSAALSLATTGLITARKYLETKGIAQSVFALNEMCEGDEALAFNWTLFNIPIIASAVNEYRSELTCLRARATRELALEEGVVYIARRDWDQWCSTYAKANFNVKDIYMEVCRHRERIELVYSSEHLIAFRYVPDGI